jgi:hypothetical protein
MNVITKEQIKVREDQIRRKRMETLVGAWELMKGRFLEVEKNAYALDSLFAEVVENYLQDRQALVTRSNITGRIQRHKIAGLMAASIVKIRPIQLREGDTKAARVSRDNEAFAILHGLGVCAEGQHEALKRLRETRNFGKWFSDFVYYLVRRRDSAECCATIFGTISLTYFPGNLDSAQ